MAMRNMLAAGAILAVLILIAAVVIFTGGDDDDGEEQAVIPTPTVADQGQAETSPEAEETPEFSDPGGTPQDSDAATDEDAGVLPTATQVEPGDPAPAPEPPFEGAFGFGTEAGEDVIAEIDIDIPPSGEGLPDGSGTAEQGAEVYAAECAHCHGQTGTEGGLGPVLVSEEPGTWESGMPKTIGNYWPYATTIWDYVNRSMPFDHPGSLEPDDVYAVTAFLLAENDIIAGDEEMNAETLPQVEMPNQPNFVPCWPDECRDEFVQSP